MREDAVYTKVAPSVDSRDKRLTAEECCLAEEEHRASPQVITSGFDEKES